MKSKLEQFLKDALVVLLVANLLLQGFSLVQLHLLREARQESLTTYEKYLEDQQNQPRYYCGNYYLHHSQDSDRGVVLYPWNGEENICNGGISIPDEDAK